MEMIRLVTRLRSRSSRLQIFTTVTAVLLLSATAQGRSKKEAAPAAEAPAATPTATASVAASVEAPRVKDDAPSHVARARELFQEGKFGEAGDELQIGRAHV